VAIECKLSAHPEPGATRGIRQLHDFYGRERVAGAFVACTAEDSRFVLNPLQVRPMLPDSWGATVRRSVRILGAMEEVRIVVADDHVVVRQGLRALLEREPGFRVVGEAADGSETLEMVERLSPDVLVLDLTMPGIQGLEITRRVARRTPEIHVVILSMHNTVAYVSEALRRGACGYVVKEASSEQLCLAIKEAMAGRIYLSPPLSREAVETHRRRGAGTRTTPDETLTPRERQVLALAAEGLCAREIAERLAVSPRTAEVHRANLMHKLGLHSQTDLVHYAMTNGLIPMPDASVVAIDEQHR